MADLYDEGFDAGLKKGLATANIYREALAEMLTMFEAIERNRDLPAFSDAVGQYVATGKVIRKLLEIDPRGG